MVHTRAFLVIIGLLLACFSAACGRAVDVQVDRDTLKAYQPAKGPKDTPIVIVSTPFFSSDHEPFEVYQKTYDILDAFTNAGVATVAPWEYRVYRGRDNLLLGSNVSSLLREEGLHPYDAFELEVRVVMNTGQGAVVASDAKRASSRVLQRGKIRMHLKSLWDQEVLLSLTVSFEEDPRSQEITSYNTTPILQRAMRTAVARMSERIHTRYGGKINRAPGVQVTYNAKPMFSYTLHDEPPLKERFHGLDALENVALKMRYYQYFDPELSVEQLYAFEALDGGLWIKSPGWLSAHGLKAGDYVKTVDGKPALGPQVLARPLLKRRKNEVLLLVERAGDDRLVPISLRSSTAQESSP